MLAKHIDHQTMTDVPVTTGGTPLKLTSPFTLKGIYTYKGVSYDCTKEGLYRFFDESNGTCFNTIVGVDWAGGTDIYKFMSAISNNHLHGTNDNTTYYQGVSNNMRYRKMRSQCGYIAGFCNWILPQIGFTSRVVDVDTLGTLNGWDDGHIIVETQHGSDWRMWDITNGCYFRDANGDHMSTAGFISQIANGGAFPTKVSIDMDTKYNSDSIYGIDLQIYGELFHATPAQSEVWYRHVFQS